VDSADFNILATQFGTSIPGDGGESARPGSGTATGGSADLYRGDQTDYSRLAGSSRLMGSLFGDSEKIDFDLPGTKA
jgi:hypothetical protein